jgi:H+-translocating NAD(P) transhydrogenase subunit beta
VIFVKRSLGPGFAGVGNELFYQENTMMFFADAAQGLEDITEAVRNA